MRVITGLKKRALELTDQKYDWLEMREKECKEEGVKFELDIEVETWYTQKIAKLELLIENL